MSEPTARRDAGLGEHPADADAAAGDVPGVREQYRRQLIEGIGGWSGTLITAIPTVVFVIVNAVRGLHWAIVAAVGSAAVLAGYRMLRRQPLQQVLSGLVGVVVASLIAARTGQARSYFLLGIWSSFAYAAVFAASLAVRRPLIGLLWEFVDPFPADDGVRWYRRRTLLRAYMLATLAATAVFAARGVVQLTLFRHDATGWLAFARVAMGYPLYIAALGYAVWVIRRARHRLAAH